MYMAWGCDLGYDVVDNLEMPGVRRLWTYQGGGGGGGCGGRPDGEVEGEAEGDR